MKVSGRWQRSTYLLSGKITCMEKRFCDEQSHDDSNNPFSFKNFLQSSKQIEDRDEDEDEKYNASFHNTKVRKTLVIIDGESSKPNASDEDIALNSCKEYTIPDVLLSEISEHVDDALQSQLPILPEIIPKTVKIDSFRSPETVISNLPDFCCADTSEKEIVKLQDEIKLLNKLLNEIREDNVKLSEEMLSKNTRINKLEEEVKKLKHREAEDLLSLEKMVQQVEQNLKLMTERTLCAESTISRQHQENKVLQDKVNMLQKEKQQYLENVTLAAEQLSEKLNVVADGAEASLKSLLEGVEQLRTFSSFAASISRIHEERT